MQIVRIGGRKVHQNRHLSYTPQKSKDSMFVWKLSYDDYLCKIILCEVMFQQCRCLGEKRRLEYGIKQNGVKTQLA